MRLESKLITNGKWFNQWRLLSEASIRMLNYRVQRASRLVNTSRCWEGGVSGKGMKTPCGFFKIDFRERGRVCVCERESNINWLPPIPTKTQD